MARITPARAGKSIFFAVINRIYHIDRNLITSYNMFTLNEDTINPILFARNIFRCTQFESHSSKFSH